MDRVLYARTRCAITIDGAGFDARAVGRTTLTCARGALDIDVRGIERIEIEGPDTVGGQTVYFRVRAFGDGRELDLGEGFAVSWSHDASLVRSRCRSRATRHRVL